MPGLSFGGIYFLYPPRKCLGKCTILSGCFTGQIHLQTPSKNKILMILFFLIAWVRATRHSSRVAREVPLAHSQFLYLVPFIFLKGCGRPLLLCFKDLFCLNYISPAKKRKDERLEWLLWVVLPQLKMEKERSVSRRWTAALGAKKITSVTKGFYYYYYY